MNRQRDLLIRQRLGPLDRPGDLVWNRRKGGLRGNQRRIVDRGPHSALFEMGAKRRPAVYRNAHREQVPGGPEPVPRRHGPDVGVRQLFKITAPDLRSAGVPLF